jgi:hypothetical protein
LVLVLDLTSGGRRELPPLFLAGDAQRIEWQLHRKSDQRRDDLCAGGLRKRALT